MPPTLALTKQHIESALARLGELASAEGYTIEVNVYGGAALAIAYNMRAATGDVDAVFSDPPLVRRLAQRVAAERGWPEDWLNDGVKGFLSSAEDLKSQMERPGIRVQVPTTAY